MHYAMRPSGESHQIFSALTEAGQRAGILDRYLHHKPSDGRTLAFSMLVLAWELRTMGKRPQPEAEEQMALNFLRDAQDSSPGPLYELTDAAGKSPLSFAVKVCTQACFHCMARQPRPLVLPPTLLRAGGLAGLARCC